MKVNEWFKAWKGRTKVSRKRLKMMASHSTTSSIGRQKAVAAFEEQRRERLRATCAAMQVGVRGQHFGFELAQLVCHKVALTPSQQAWVDAEVERLGWDPKKDPYGWMRL